jgi:hypothetical protein
MSHISRVQPRVPATVGPLVLCDRFLRLAEEADHAGFRPIAETLIRLAYDVLDAPPACAH